MKNRSEGAFREWALREGLIREDVLAEADALMEEREDEATSPGACRVPLSPQVEREASRRVRKALQERAGTDDVPRDSNGISMRVREHFALHGIDLGAMAREVA